MEKLEQTIKEVVLEESENLQAAIAALEDGAYLGQLKARLGCSDDELQAAVETVHAEMGRYTALADELLAGCPDDLRADHETIAEAVRCGKTREQILDMPETNRWPDTYVWLSERL